MKELQDIQVTIVEDVTSQNYKLSRGNLLQILGRIKNGNKFIDVISKVRDLKLSQGKSSLYKETRKVIPAICYNSTFPTNKRTKATAIPTGLFYIDIDKENISKEYFLSLEIGKHIIALWHSVGGKGLSGLIRIEGVVDNYQSLLAQLNSISNNLLDKQCSDITRVNFLSYDKDMYLNFSAKYYKQKKVYLGNNIPSSSFQLLPKYTFSPSILLPKYTFSGNNNAFKTTNATEFLTGDSDYEVFSNGVETVRCFFPRFVKRGNRRSTFLSYFTNFFIINPHKFSYEFMFTTIKRLSFKCEGGMIDNKKVMGIYMTLKKQIDSNTLAANKSGLKRRIIIFKDNCDLNKKEKMSIVAKEVAKVKSKRTLDKIDEFFGDTLWNLPEKCTYKTIAAYVGKSEITIKKRITHEQKKMIKEFNNSLK